MVVIISKYNLLKAATYLSPRDFTKKHIKHPVASDFRCISMSLWHLLLQHRSYFPFCKLFNWSTTWSNIYCVHSKYSIETFSSPSIYLRGNPVNPPWTCSSFLPYITFTQTGYRNPMLYFNILGVNYFFPSTNSFSSPTEVSLIWCYCVKGLKKKPLPIWTNLIYPRFFL